MKKSKKKIIYYTLILITAIIMCIPLFKNGIHTGDDGDFHISRALGTLEQIRNGNSPLVISRFSNNLGFGWNLFYPPISTYSIVLFTFLTNNVVIGMKIFLIFTFILFKVLCNSPGYLKETFLNSIKSIFPSIHILSFSSTVSSCIISK